jgi:peroxiredoxin
MSETILVAGLTLQVLTFVALTFFLYQLIRQQGRILLRLDALDGAQKSEASASHLSLRSRGFDIGATVVDFELPDVTGQKLSLSHFRGRQILLIYWSAECGFCEMTAADLAAMQADLRQNKIQLVLIAYGDAEANRTLAAGTGLNCPILLLNGSSTQTTIAANVFEYCGTPSAYLLDEQGRVAGPLAGGMDEVLDLAREATAKRHTIRKLPLAASRIERQGLKKGAVAPSFRLPDISGEIVSLDQFRGRIVLLVFTDPQCGPCDELAPELVQLHRKQRDKGLTIIMVGRGQAEQNRTKAMHYGIEFPVVLQERWKLSREYGIFDTPVAFLIDRNGIIMRGVAKGPDQIIALAHDGLASAKETRYASTV